jgi:hypothetical protein
MRKQQELLDLQKNWVFFTENKPFIETVLFNRKGDFDCESIEPKSVKVYFSISSVLPVQMGGPFI